MERSLEPAISDLRPAEHRLLTKQSVVWLACILAAIFCVWRMAVFIPQPLDSAGTLRPVLYGLLTRFIKHYGSPEQAFSAWYTFCGIALLIPAALAFLNYLIHSEHPLRGRIPGWLCSRTLLAASIAICLFICRYPTFLEPELNPDEGQFLASAHKLFYDANFFRAADCGTSGPINIYPLMLPAIVGISPDYASGRVIVLIILLLCLWLLYRTFLLIAPDEVARIAVLPAAGMFAVFKHPNLVHYSSEHVPVLLASVGLYAVVRVLRRPADYQLPLFLLGFLSSAEFFAKMQALPILAALAAVAIAYLYLSGNVRDLWRPPLLFLAGIMPLPILNTALCIATGVWSDFWMSYIVTNLHYADVENRFVTDLPQLLKYLGDTDEVRVFLFTSLGLGAAFAFQRLRRRPAEESNAFLETAGVSAIAISAANWLYLSNFSPLSAYLALIAIAAAAVYLLLRWQEQPLGQDPLRWFGLLGILFAVAAAFSVYEAHRVFPHYLLFLFIPISTAIAWMLIRQSGVAFVALLVVLTVVSNAYLWGKQDDHVFKNAPLTLRAPEGDFIRSLTTPDGQIAVWGWAVAPYLGSGRVPATRDTNMANFFRWPEISIYYRKRFLRDMRRDPPELFVDAVGPTSWSMIDRQAFAFEQFPEIEAFISTHYAHLADRYGQRYFLRRDIAAPR